MAASLASVELFSEPAQGRSLWQDSWTRLAKNKSAVVGGAVFLFIVLACFLGPYVTGWHPDATNLSLKAQPPGVQETVDGVSRTHLLGTDVLGRDLLTRILKGGQVSLKVAMVATVVALIIGVLYGATAGYVGGRTDAFMMRAVDVLYALPFMIFVILLVTMFGDDPVLMYLAIGAVEWLTMARIVRSQVMGIARMEYVDAARSLGLPAWRIIVSHIIPNILGPVIVYATLTVPGVMLLEAGLSFLGQGIKPPNSSWGTLIDYGAGSMEEYPWLLFYPGLFFSVTLLCVNFVGDGLRDALDVRGGTD